MSGDIRGIVRWFVSSWPSCGLSLRDAVGKGKERRLEIWTLLGRIELRSGGSSFEGHRASVI